MACDAAATSAPTRMKRALLGAQGEQPAARRAEMAVAPISCAPVALAQAAKEWAWLMGLPALATSLRVATAVRPRGLARG